ncbi:hypothetical protein [Mesoplasma seiffertii]|uniref:hypothetical protein n=1 Tax=Mesoplasma seiffertii TaxID=28224 RepID=UPI00047A3A71|nr:hypothetical protein [Mesoplasma seiffertii]
MNSYELIYDFKENKHYNNELYNIIKKSSKSYFEDWMLKGHWDENYYPMALINEKNDIVAAVCVIRLNLSINEVKCNAIQVGRIFIKDSYEHDQVDKKLLDLVVEKYSNVSDLIYSFSDSETDALFMNSEFQKVQEFIYYIPWNSSLDTEKTAIKKLDTDSIKDIEFIQDHIKHATKTPSMIATNGDSSVKLYNILKFYRRNVYYISEIDAVVVFTINQAKKRFTLVAIYSSNKIDIMDILKILVPDGIERVEFMFIPNLNCGVNIRKLSFIETPEGNVPSYLYMKEITTALEGKKIFFPVLGRGK